MRFTPRTGLITIGLAIGAIAAPSAQATSVFTPPRTPTQSVHSLGLPTFEDVEGARLALLAQRYDERTTTPAVNIGSRAIFVPHPHNQPVLHRSLPRASAATTSSSSGFQLDDAAAGAGAIVGLALLGAAGTLTARRRIQVRHP